MGDQFDTVVAELRLNRDVTEACKEYRLNFTPYRYARPTGGAR